MHNDIKGKPSIIIPQSFDPYGCEPFGFSRIRRPKLLFLSRPFPPLQVIGCVRTWNIAKCLSRLGWDVTVVTPQPEMWANLEDVEKTQLALEQEGIKKLLTAHQWQCLVTSSKQYQRQGVGRVFGGMCRTLARTFGIDNGIGWMHAAEQACKTLTENDVDLILATGSPFSAFRVAQRISKRLGCPYVMDYRDLWTDNLHGVGWTRESTIQEEAQLLKGAGAVTIVSSSWGLDLKERYRLGGKLHVVTNGYDHESLAEVNPYSFDHFAIVYAGTFYPPKRSISPLMAALQRLKNNMLGGCIPEWFFHYYGNDCQYVLEEAQQSGVEDKVVLHGKVSRQEALSAVKGAGVAVVITSLAEKATLADKGMVPAKVYEAMGLETPILVIAPQGSDIEGVIEQASMGKRFDGLDIEGIEEFLMGLMKGALTPNSPSQEYAWENIGKKFDDLLRTVMCRV